MKHWIISGAGVVAATALAVIFWPPDPASIEREKNDKEEAVKAASFLPLGQRGEGKGPAPAPDIATQIDALLADGTIQSWTTIGMLYKGADEATKRRVLEAATSQRDLRTALTYILLTVGDDARPIEGDSMVGYTAELLKSRWQQPGDVQLGRTTMLMQKSDRKRWVLAKALVDFSKDLGSDSPFQQAKDKLTTNLIDLHADVSDPFVKSAISDSMLELGSSDLAVLLAKGTEAPIEDMEFMRAEKSARDEALKQANTEE